MFNLHIDGGTPVILTRGSLLGLCRELVARGWWVTAAERERDALLIGFDFLPHRAPSWRKAFEVPWSEADIEGVERHVEGWKAKVRRDLADGSASPLVRQMVAEHGPEVVRAAMEPRHV